MKRQEDLTRGRYMRRLLESSRLSPAGVADALLQLAQPNPPRLHFARFTILATEPTVRVAPRIGIPGLRPTVEIEVRPRDGGGSTIDCLASPASFLTALFKFGRLLCFVLLATCAYAVIRPFQLSDGSEVWQLAFAAAVMSALVAATAWMARMNPLPLTIMKLEQALDAYGIIFTGREIREAGQDDD